MGVAGMTFKKTMKNSEQLKAASMLQEIFNFGETNTRDDDTVNECFCRMLEAVNVKYKLTTKDGQEMFILV